MKDSGGNLDIITECFEMMILFNLFWNTRTYISVIFSEYHTAVTEDSVSSNCSWDLIKNKAMANQASLLLAG